MVLLAVDFPDLQCRSGGGARNDKHGVFWMNPVGATQKSPECLAELGQL